MILLIKGQSNQITLTLTEKCALANPYFLFKFKQQIGQQEIFLILADTSQYKGRYNRFTFVEPAAAELSEGLWTYEVYEQASSSNIDTTGLNMVEEGVMKVVDPATPIEPAIYEGETKTASVYQ